MIIPIKQIITENLEMPVSNPYDDDNLNNIDSLVSKQYFDNNNLDRYADRLHDIRTVPSERSFYSQDETQDDFNKSVSKFSDRQLKINRNQIDVNSKLFKNNDENSDLANNALNVGILGVGLGAAGVGLGLHNRLKNRNQR